MAVPVAPGVVMVEKVEGAGAETLQRQDEDPANPLRGIWGSDPDAWVEAIRGAWGGREAS